ncbi:MAG: hypothetical protein HQK65_16950 [Desulfamplus sp.]|nr:hypothetical protein [Desulfamplus sp.]
MNFIPVGDVKLNALHIMLMSAIANITGAHLTSLINAFKQTQFGLDTLYKFRRDLEKYIPQVITPAGARLYIDSGGYSFIKGYIHPDDISKLIACYLHFMIDEMKSYYRIFSLDLPFSKKYNLYNTKDNIYNSNRFSLLETFRVIEQIPELSEKFIFIWQFRLEDTYRLWCKIHDELIDLGYSKLITHRAIGGMVGLKGETKIIFSPFMALAYRCFKDYIVTGIYHIPFQLHLLGVYILSDRFMIAYVEKVFNRYLTQLSINSGVRITYDSTNYFRTAQYNARNLLTHSFDNGQLHHYPSVQELPDHIIKKVYFTDDLYFHIQSEIQRLKDGKKMIEGNSFAPLNAFNFIEEDRFLEDAIERYGLIEPLFETHDIASFREETELILDQILLSTPHLFGPRFKVSIMDNMIKLYRLHKWWAKEGANYESLNILIEEFIGMIGAEGSLK